MSDSVRPHRRQPTRLPRPWDSPGKNTGVGCHFLLWCMKGKVKVKSLSRVRLCATPWTAAHQAPPRMGFSRQEYWSGVPVPSPTSIPKLWSPLSTYTRPTLLVSHYFIPPKTLYSAAGLLGEKKKEITQSYDFVFGCVHGIPNFLVPQLWPCVLLAPQQELSQAFSLFLSCSSPLSGLQQVNWPLVSVEKR